MEDHAAKYKYRRIYVHKTITYCRGVPFHRGRELGEKESNVRLGIGLSIAQQQRALEKEVGAELPHSRGEPGWGEF